MKIRFLRNPYRDVINRTSGKLQLEKFWGSDIVRCCCEKLMAEAGDISGTQRKGRPPLKPLPGNGSNNVTVDTSVCVIGNCDFNKSGLYPEAVNSHTL
jgi:hypothetical protein